MAVDMNPPYSKGVVRVADSAVKDFEARGFTRVAKASAPAKSTAKKSTSK